jgi:hypothetical protein
MWYITGVSSMPVRRRFSYLPIGWISGAGKAPSIRQTPVSKGWPGNTTQQKAK